MMEYVKFPFWVNSWENINSNNIKRFRETLNNFDDKNICLDLLREYYIENKVEFIDLVDELSLRGFEFYNNKSNNLLHSYKYECGYFLIARDNTNIKEVNFEKFLLGDFTRRFHIDNSDFLNYVPIEGFRVFNPEINIEHLKEEFSRCNFTIEKYNINENIDTVDKVIKVEREKSDGVITYKDINRIFSDKSYNAALKFLNSKQIEYVDEITYDTIYSFVKSNGAGVKKVQRFLIKLFELYNETNEFLHYKYNVEEIKFWYCEIEFYEFREFCSKCGIIKVNEINEDVIKRASEVNTITPKDISRIREKLENYKIITNKLKSNVDIDDLEKLNQKDKVEKLENYGVITNKLKSVVDISDLERLNENNEWEKLKNIWIVVNEYWKNKLKDLKINEIVEVLDIELELNSDLTIGEIDNKLLSEIEFEGENEDLIELINYINNIENPVNILLSLKDIITKERDKLVIEFRYNEGQTLDYIGNKFNISKERVRQIQLRYIRKVNKLLKINKINESLKLEFKCKNNCSLKMFYSLFPVGVEYFVKLILSGNTDLYLFKPLNLVYFNMSEDIQEKVNKIISSIPSVIKLSDYEDMLVDYLIYFGIEEPDTESIEKILKSCGYKIYGEYAIKDRMTVLLALDIIFKDYINTPIKLNEDGYLYIKSLAKNKLSYDLGDTLRSVDVRLRDNGNILLVDRLTFIHVEKLELHENIIEKIREILDSIFKNLEVVNASTVYSENEELLKTSGVKNKQMLYSLVRHYFSDIYKVGKGNTLDIYKSNDINILNRDEIMIKLIRENGGNITKEYLASVTGWDEFKIENAIVDSNKVVKFNKDIFLISDFIITEEEKERLYTIIEKLINREQFTTINIIYKEVMFDSKLSNLIKVNNICVAEKFGVIIKKIYKGLKGHSTFITNKKSSYKSIEEVVSNKFLLVHSKEEIKEYLKTFEYKDMFITTVFRNLINSGEFIEISKDEVVNKNEFNIESEVIDEVIKYINNEFINKEFLVLSDLIGYRRMLPRIDYKWNAYLLKAIVECRGYKSIKRIYSDHRYEKLIVVKETSDINTYAELLFKIISNDYFGNMHEVKIYDYLSKLGLVRIQDNIYDRKIPYDLKVSGKIKIDELGRVELVK